MVSAGQERNQRQGGVVSSECCYYLYLLKALWSPPVLYLLSILHFLPVWVEETLFAGWVTVVASLWHDSWLLSLQQDAVVVLLQTFMKYWHKSIPGLFLIVLAPGVSIAFLVFSYGAPQHSWLRDIKKERWTLIIKSCRVCSGSVYLESSRWLFSCSLYMPCLEYMLWLHHTHRMCLTLARRCITTQIWSCHFHV